jgi:hypothetical protein
VEEQNRVRFGEEQRFEDATLLALNMEEGATCRWPIPVILATQESEIRRIAVQNQPRQIVHKTLS